MVPAEEVTRFLRCAALPSSASLFPSVLLDSALNKMRASIDALVQKTLHPPMIPWKSLAGPIRADSPSTSSAARGAAVAEAGSDGLLLFLYPSGWEGERARRLGALFVCLWWLWPLRSQT